MRTLQIGILSADPGDHHRPHSIQALYALGGLSGRGLPEATAGCAVSAPHTASVNQQLCDALPMSYSTRKTCMQEISRRAQLKVLIDKTFWKRKLYRMWLLQLSQTNLTVDTLLLGLHIRGAGTGRECCSIPDEAPASSRQQLAGSPTAVNCFKSFGFRVQHTNIDAIMSSIAGSISSTSYIVMKPLHVQIGQSRLMKIDQSLEPWSQEKMCPAMLVIVHSCNID